ncbi:hypothetical protein CFE70_004787 [Pyrenophora teres f. teres 0-1]
MSCNRDQILTGAGGRAAHVHTDDISGLNVTPVTSETALFYANRSRKTSGHMKTLAKADNMDDPNPSSNTQNL